MTREQILARFPNASETFIAANVGAGKKTQEFKTLPVKTVKPVFAVGADTDELKLNKTEKAFLAFIRTDPNKTGIQIQAITLKLGFDCRLTMDFFYIENGVPKFVDTKGGHTWEDSIIKMKTAARKFTWAEFWIAKKDPSQPGGWLFKKVNP